MEYKIYDDYRKRALDTEEVVAYLRNALEQKQPFALIRISHAEAQLIGHVSGIKKKRRENFLGYFAYCGVREEEYAPAVNDLLDSLKHGDLAGVGLKEDKHHEFPLVQKILAHYELKLPALVCSNKINRKLIRRKEFFALLQNRRIVVIGRRAEESSNFFSELGFQMAGAFSVESYRDIDKVMEKLKCGPSFDVALISAGINAVILAVRIKKELGKVAIDFGHSLDRLIDAKSFSLRKLHQTYYAQNRFRIKERNADSKEQVSRYLSSGELMDRVLTALEQKKPLSVVSVGATETFVMAQYELLSEAEFMNHKEAKQTNSGKIHCGITFPNVQARDETVAAVKQADIVGFNTLIKDRNAGLMTEKVFARYGIQPKYIFDSLIRRVVMISQKEKFDEMMRKRKILLIGSFAEKARKALEDKEQKRLHFEIAGTVFFMIDTDNPHRFTAPIRL
ncbi:hypothetical protein BSNK01_14310 [Bacillaceae bacterium]